MMAERNVRFNVNPYEIQVENQGHNDGNDNDNAQIVQNNDQVPQIIIPAGVPRAVQTTLAFKLEQSKIPEFYGQKGKDNITAIVFIRKIDDLAQTNRWNDTTTYANMANTLKGFAHNWLFAAVKTLDGTADQLTSTNLKPRFQRQFATQTDEKMIIEGLSNLAMKPYKSTGELLARITSTMVILKTATLTTRTSQPLQHTTISMGATRWTPQPGGRMRP
jgi:hypothetical protein